MGAREGRGGAEQVVRNGRCAATAATATDGAAASVAAAATAWWGEAVAWPLLPMAVAWPLVLRVCDWGSWRGEGGSNEDARSELPLPPSLTFGACRRDE